MVAFFYKKYDSVGSIVRIFLINKVTGFNLPKSAFVAFIVFAVFFLGGYMISTFSIPPPISSYKKGDVTSKFFFQVDPGLKFSKMVII